MKKYLFKNQQLILEKQATISPHERGFLFGDGLFETCKIIDGKIIDFDLHLTRINKALALLKFSAETKNLEKNSYELIKKNSLKNGILRISLSRGIGSKGYLPTYESKALTIIETFFDRELPKKIRLGIAKTSTPGMPFKPMSALPYVLARIEAEEQKTFDVVMLSEKKFVAETSSANIFWVKNSTIYTPDESCGIVLGCVRERLLKMPGIKIKKTKARLAALKNADEIFLTNSAFLVILVDEFLGKKLAKNVGEKISVELRNLQN
jgi:branched-subunit amino acid aminotransferase/4-amino-4-deoxychorismate lyase